MQQRLNRLFGGNFSTLQEEALSTDLWTPVCDIYETDNEIVIKLELPDVKKEEVKIGIEDNRLEITGERKFAQEVNRENYKRVERSYGKFLRSFTLPDSVETSKVSAEFKEGVLHIAMPKLEAAKTKKIEVKVK
jgi:HSP20 family protein